MAYAIKQNEIDYDASDLVMMQVQLLNRDNEGRVMVEKISADYSSASAGKYYIPGVAMKFGEHPEEAGHRILTEELEIKNREIKLIGSQSHWNDEKNHCRRGIFRAHCGRTGGCSAGEATYVAYSGTSMATPMVAGMVALRAAAGWRCG
jgi:ADP-ribose pyrophosphatase YjhB (NUDIX family)